MKKPSRIALLCILLTFLAIPLHAADVSDLTYDASGPTITITDCDEAASGALVIPDTIEGKPVTSIGVGAFYDCTSLTSIIIPDSVTSIGRSAFSTCESLTSIAIPDSVTSIGDGAFAVCRSLTSITIPDSVTSIGKEPFYFCFALKSVIIGNGVTSIGDGAFVTCLNLKTIEVGAGNMNYTATNGVLFSKEKTLGASYSQNFDGFDDGTTDLEDGSVMTGAAASVQDGRLQLTIDQQGLGFSSFSVPALPGSSQGFTASFDYELYDSPGANDPADGFSFNYGNAPLGDQGQAEEGMAGRPGVTENISWEVDTWRNGDAEQGVNISGLAGGADLGQLDFTNGIILEDDSRKTGTIEISWNPAVGASFTTTGMTTNADFSNVDTGAFVAEDGHNFIISARVGGANEDLFIDNLVITVDGTDDADRDGLPDYVHTYPRDKTGDNYTIPDGVTSIGDYAFRGCTNLRSITIPDSVTSIGYQAFLQCPSLTSVTIPDSVTSIGELAFHQCPELTSITIPDGVTSIGDGTFNGCISLTSITIPDSVTSIADWAFADCFALKSVIIGNSVTSIGDWAFVDCESLTDITFRGNAPTLGGGNVFLRVPANAKVFIYEGASGFGGRFGGFSVVVQKNPFAGDTDKDGWKDETEVLFGSSPDNAKSVPAFKLKMNVLEGDQLELLFPGEEGARYSVQTSDDMKTWLSLEKLIIGQGDTISERFSISGGLGFYRIREEQ